MKSLLLMVAATLCFAASESRISRDTILAVEGTVNQTLRGTSSDPYELLGNARGTYLDGYGALFTFEIDLVPTGGFAISPFSAAKTPEDVAKMRDRKVKKLPELKDTMRNIMMSASSTLEGLPPGERVAMEATLFNFSWEKNGKEIPRRIFMSAEKQKLLDAKANHATPAELAAIIEEQDR